MPCDCPEGMEYFCDRKQIGARVNGAISSAVEKVGESLKNEELTDGGFDAVE